MRWRDTRALRPVICTRKIDAHTMYNQCATALGQSLSILDGSLSHTRRYSKYSILNNILNILICILLAPTGYYTTGYMTGPTYMVPNNVSSMNRPCPEGYSPAVVNSERSWSDAHRFMEADQPGQALLEYRVGGRTRDPLGWEVATKEVLREGEFIPGYNACDLNRFPPRIFHRGNSDDDSHIN